jgi:para-nitrobenzyl esterase
MLNSSAMRQLLPVACSWLLLGCGGGGSLTGAPADAGDGGAEQGADADAGNDADADAGACASSVSPMPGLVVTDRGAVQGTQVTGAWAYLGLPYAAPPVSPLRWSAPQAHACWSTTLAASSFGAKCLQIDPQSPANNPAVIGQEDCLTVNVWTPASAMPASKLPVMLFIHGGGNVQGSSSDTDKTGAPIYDGAAFAASASVVVVTFNYRLGALGFLAHPSFGADPGNYGTLDQIFAAAWVQRNVAAFGGDPAHVALFGQSAGSVDVCALVASPLAKGLFAGAVLESGGCVAQTKTAAQTFAQTWAQKAHCDTATDPAACMRALDGNAVTLVSPDPAMVSSSGTTHYQPNADGTVLTDIPHAVIASGMHNHVPLVLGSNSDETALELTQLHPMGMTDAEYQAAVLAYASGNQAAASQIVAQYPSANYASPLEAFIQVTTDAKFVCTTRYDARAAAKGQTDAGVWRYFFTHHLDTGGTALHDIGAWHGLELAFIFRDLGASGYKPSAGETALADAIDHYWSSIASSGDPSTGAAVAWPKYDPTNDTFLQLDDTIQAGTQVRQAQCDFWDQLLMRP